MRYREKQDPHNGLLNIRHSATLPGYWRYLPSPDLAPFVEHYWNIEWRLEEPQLRETLPYPSAHVVLEPGVAELRGVTTRKYSRILEGSSRVLGVKLRPGGLRPLVRQPASDFTDRVLPLQEVFGEAAHQLDARALAHADHHASIAVVEDFLRSLEPQADETLAQVTALADRIRDDRDLRQVEQLADLAQVSMRQLQRLFAQYVGVSPKWMIRRYRLQEAAELIASATHIDWAQIALELGYADQAHFNRDFKAVIGRSPGSYRKALAPMPAS